VPETDALARRLHARLHALDRDGLSRTLRAPSGIDLSSNDYLGLAQHPRLKQRMAEAVLEHGCGSTGSRLLRGERAAFQRVEQRFAAFKGTERALYFSSGYLANIAVLSTFAESGDVIYSDQFNHASLIDSARLSRARRVVYPHNDLGALERLLRENRPEGQAFVVTESLFSMLGDLAPLRELASLCRSTGASLIVDEAHAVGIYGSRGSGMIESAEVDGDVFVSINTAGKALGVGGAFVAGSALAMETLVQRARPFIFSTAPPPAMAAALDASLDLIEQEPDRRATLLRLAACLRSRLAIPGTSQIIPVLLGSNERAVQVAEDLQEAGFDVRAIRPPSVPHGAAQLRISINVNLTEDALDRFARALSEALQESSCAASS
jgi:8-amino-7-oxononanoate synthase